MLNEGTGRTGERNVVWRNRVDWRAESWMKEQSELESGRLTEGTERTGSGMLTGGTERTGEGNVDWRNRVGDSVTGRKAVLLIFIYLKPSYTTQFAKSNN